MTAPRYVSLFCRTLASAAVAAGLLVAAGCQGSRQARSVETSGFLGDYSQLTEGEDGEALMRYVNPDADFRTYNAILMEPVKVYPGVGDSFLRTMKEEDIKKLVDYLDATLREQLSGSYKFVEAPGPGVMRFRIALTESDPGKVAIDVISSVVPVGMALSAISTVAFGEGSGVGDASIEFEALDSVSGDRLAAAVDRRVGQKYTGKFDKFDRWRATKSAFDFWAERLKDRLAELRAGNQ